MKSRYMILVCSVIVCIAYEHYAAGAARAQGDMMRIISNQFQDGGTMPEAHTCDGQGVSPQLSWQGIPAQTKSLALICDDPDAPGSLWTHWVVFNIPPTVKEFEQGQNCASVGAQVGANSWRKPTYGGPCPPSGTHRYYFKLYALDTMLDLKSGASRMAIENAMSGHVLAQAQIMARYTREQKDKKERA